MTVLEAKKKYNELIVRYNNATKYFEREDVPNGEKEKHLASFQAILHNLNYCLRRVGGYKENQALEGFYE